MNARVIAASNAVACSGSRAELVERISSGTIRWQARQPATGREGGGREERRPTTCCPSHCQAPPHILPQYYPLPTKIGDLLATELASNTHRFTDAGERPRPTALGSARAC
jgi:hypothetical protein